MFTSYVKGVKSHRSNKSLLIFKNKHWLGWCHLYSNGFSSQFASKNESSQSFINLSKIIQSNFLYRNLLFLTMPNPKILKNIFSKMACRKVFFVQRCFFILIFRKLICYLYSFFEFPFYSSQWKIAVLIDLKFSHLSREWLKH